MPALYVTCSTPPARAARRSVLSALILLLLLLLLSGAVMTTANAQPAPPTNVALLGAPQPPAVSGVSATFTGTGPSTGASGYCWWVVPSYPIGDGPVSAPACLGQIPPLSATNTVRVNWSAPSGTTGYNVLRTDWAGGGAPVPPGASCVGCLIGTTTATATTDTGAAGTNYTANPASAVQYSLFLDNLTGAVPVVRTQLGQTGYIQPQVSTANGTPATGNCVQFGPGGSLVDAGTVCGTGAGTVTGPGMSTNNAIALWDGVTGTVLKDSATLLPTGSLVGTGQANTYTTGAQSFAAASSLVLPTGAGLAPTAAASIGYNSTNNRAVVGTGAATATLATQGAASTNGNCAQYDANGALTATGSACASAPTVTWPYLTIAGADYLLGSYPATRIVPGDWTSTNLGAATRTDLPSGAISLRGTTDSTWRMVCRSVPATPYTAELALMLSPFVVESGVRVAIGWRESGTGELSLVSIRGGIIRLENWTNPTTFSADVTNNTFQQPGALFSFQFGDDGATNRTVRVWNGAATFNAYAGTQWTIARTTFLTPDQFCFGVFSDNGNYPPYAVLASYAP